MCFSCIQNSQSIIDCFLREVKKSGVKIETGKGIKEIKPIDDRLELHFLEGEVESRTFDKVIVATGGFPIRKGLQNNNLVVDILKDIIEEYPNKLLSNFRPHSLPSRLWLYLLEKGNLSEKKKWCKLGKKGINKLVSILTNDIYSVKGKTSFKEEFVTCGGISLDSVDFNTMQSRVCKNLYFAGEVLDIDGITGGYNLQAAWTTGFIAGQLK